MPFFDSAKITSTTGGKHKDDSLHYSGNAVDIRHWDEAGKRIKNWLQSREGKAWAQNNSIDVKFESDHIHLERDIKRDGG